MVINLVKISIIIPVFNSEKTVKKCIESLFELDFPKNKMEIIFVDDGSIDNTKKIIKNYNHVKLIEQNHKGPASARNNGIRKSSGDFIFFTDSDCIVPKNWVTKMLGRFENNIAMVGGSLVPFSLNKLSERFEQSRRDRLYGNKLMFVNALPSCNMAVRRKVIEEIKGFDENFKYPSFEDYDLCFRIKELGYNILYDPDIGVIHLHSPSWIGVFKRALRHGKEGVRFRSKLNYKGDDEGILFISNLFLFPFRALKYPSNLIICGFIYEFLNIVGELIGIIRMHE